MDYGILHIRKAGGTALRHMLNRALRDYSNCPKFEIYNHPMTLEAMWRDHQDRQAIFIVRDPVDRFISGFNGRLRQGKPRYDTPWRAEEAEVFKVFRSPNELAEALYPPRWRRDSKWRQAAARIAILTLGHTRYPLSYWLKSPEYLEENKSRIAFVGNMPELDNDISKIAGIMGLPSSLSLPANKISANRSPDGEDRHLSKRGRANIMRWYKDDYKILDWCMEWRKEHILSR